MTRVLVVDDSLDMAKLLAKIVEEQGHEVRLAGSGKQALRMAAAEPIDVVLLDVMMPCMSGLEVLHKLKEDERLQAVPVLLVTAKGEDEDVILGLDAGAHDYITKPFNRQVLSARLRSAVRSKQDHDRLLRINERLKLEMAERRRMEQELVRSQRLEAVGHLAAGIAHEINTPVQYVGDNTRFLNDAFTNVGKLLNGLEGLLAAAKQGAVPEPLLADVDAALRNAEVAYLKEEIPVAIEQSLEGLSRVASIVKAMKEFAHPGNGHKQYLDLNRAIQSTLTVSRNEWKYVADVITDFAGDLPMVPCLAGDFNQVVLNLVVNAAQAIANVVGDGSTGKGTITVRTRQDGDWVEIQIADTGTGIPVSVRDKIFDQFFTTKDVGQGTGLGLSIAHAIIVQKHGGSISFQTEEGEGTTFTIRLPVSDPADLAETPRQEPLCEVAP
jgi:signal transduction histidine kinase